MYISGFVIPVPQDRKDAYLALAKTMGPMFCEYGALEIIEGWENDVPDGEQTDFRKAVQAGTNEKIVFSLIIWPDKDTHDRAHKEMMEDQRMQSHPDIPFDGKRMILGGFDGLFTMGR